MLRLQFLNLFSGGRPVTGTETTPTLVGELARVVGSASAAADVLDVTTARLGRLRKGTVTAREDERAALVAAVRRLRLPRDLDPAAVTFGATDHHGREVTIKWTSLETRPGTWEEMTRRYLTGDDTGMVTSFVSGIQNEWYRRVFRQTWAREQRAVR